MQRDKITLCNYTCVHIGERDSKRISYNLGGSEGGEYCFNSEMNSCYNIKHGIRKSEILNIGDQNSTFTKVYKMFHQIQQNGTNATSDDKVKDER